MNFKIICVDRNDYEIAYSCKTFAAGEVQVRLGKLPVGFTATKDRKLIVVDGIIKSSDMFMELAMICDAIKNCFPASITLNLHYLPYARQDRVCSPGEAFALKQFIDMLCTIYCRRIVFDDVHSPVAIDLLDKSGLNYHVNSQTNLLMPYVDYTDLLLVSPDKGASEKTRNLAKRCSLDVVHYDKVRNPHSGAIEKTSLIGDADAFEGRDCLIVDDLADYGGTFIPIAEDLLARGARSVNLCVTHLVLPVSSDRLISSGIDNIFYVNKFNEDLGEYDKVFHASKIKEVLCGSL